MAKETQITKKELETVLDKKLEDMKKWFGVILEEQNYNFKLTLKLWGGKNCKGLRDQYRRFNKIKISFHEYKKFFWGLYSISFLQILSRRDKWDGLSYRFWDFN